MKRLLKILIGLALAIVIAAVIIPFVIPLETYKQEIAEQVKRKTGRDLNIEGDMRVTVFPSLGVHLEKVTLSNPKGYSTPNMLEVGSMTVEVASAPLLDKQVIIKQMVFDRPVVNLEINADGRPNWKFEAVATPEKPTASAVPVPSSLALISDAVAADDAKSPAPGTLAHEFLQNLELTDARINGGMIHFIDQRNKTRQDMEDVDLKVDLKNLESPLGLVGQGTWQQEKIDFDLTVKHLKPLMEGKPIDVKALIKASLISLDFQGTLANSGDMDGLVKISTPSLVKLSAWLGQPIAWEGKTQLKFAAEGDLEMRPQRYALRNATFKLDDITATGKLGIILERKTPWARLVIQTPSLDLTPYLPAGTEPKKAASLFISDAYAAPAPWNDAPMDFSFLRKADLDIGIDTGSLTVQQMHYGKTSLSFEVNGGTLNGKLNEMQLYGGNAKGTFSVASQGKGARINKAITLTGIDAQSFFKDLSGMDRITGKLNASLDVTTAGESQRQMISALGGKGSFKLANGSIQGVDLDAMMQNVQSAFASALHDSSKTNFSEISGNFALTGGVLTNNDGLFVSKNLKVNGEGNIHFPSQKLFYRLTPERVEKTIPNQPATPKGLSMMPVIIEGPFDQLRFRPDLESVAKEALKDPEKVKQTIKDVKQTIKSNKAQIKEIKKNVKQDLRNLKDLKDPQNIDQLRNMLQNLGGR